MKSKLPKVFLDSGDPLETKKAKSLVGTIDGQTTNPSLIAKNPDVAKRISSGKKLAKNELLSMYKDIVTDIAKEIAGPISIEVYADWNTTYTDMLSQAEEMCTWTRNGYIKFPTIPEGIKAANEFVKKGGRVNMTLVFEQEQAAAVYAATKSGEYESFLSPFIGRWDDRGYNGLQLVENIIKMYHSFEKIDQKESHVKVLAASIRTLDHLYSSIFMGADIVTLPLKIIEDWIGDEKWVPDKKYRYSPMNLKSIVYREIGLENDFSKYKFDTSEQSLLSEGIEKFVADWNKLLN